MHRIADGLHIDNSYAKMECNGVHGIKRPRDPYCHAVPGQHVLVETVCALPALATGVPSTADRESKQGT